MIEHPCSASPRSRTSGDPMTETDAFAVRRATPADAAALGRLLWEFNTEFDSPTDTAEVLAERFGRILQRDDVIALIVGDAKAFALITLRPAIWFDGPVAQLEELYVVPSLRNW